MRSYLQKHDKIKYSDHWSTPQDMYKQYIDILGYYDPCPLFSDDTDITQYASIKQFINPPYSNIKAWVDYAIGCHIRYQEDIVLLVPSRTDTKWFHDLLDYGVDLEFIKGRLKFGNQKGSAPFPSVLIHLRGDEK